MNDYVVYGLTGVCQIVDICKEVDTYNNETDYYVLDPVYDNNLTIKIPVNNPNIAMRPVITKDDVLSLIATMPEMESDWIDDERQRYANFRTALKSGKNEEWIKIIKTIYLQKKEKILAGKKLAKIDEDIMNTAEKNLNEEFSIALDISPDQVVPYIIKHIPQN